VGECVLDMICFIVSVSCVCVCVCVCGYTMSCGCVCVCWICHAMCVLEMSCIVGECVLDMLCFRGECVGWTCVLWVSVCVLYVMFYT
jgi:hypothetical protein